VLDGSYGASLAQDPEAPFQDATFRDWQKAFTTRRKPRAFCNGTDHPLSLFLDDFGGLCQGDFLLLFLILNQIKDLD
jgi:hypothetical protein